MRSSTAIFLQVAGMAASKCRWRRDVQMNLYKAHLFAAGVKVVDGVFTASQPEPMDDDDALRIGRAVRN